MPKPVHEKRILLLCALCACGMMAGLYAVMGIWPFGDVTVLTGDLNGQYLNYYAAVREGLLSGDGIAYSFEKGPGGSMLGILAYYIASPFNLLYLITKPVHYAGVACVIFAAKMIAACVAMAFYLGRHVPTLHYRAVPLALCYGFCAYAMAYAQNIMWHDALIFLPLIAWGIDIICEKKRPFVFALSLGAAIFTGFYTGYMLCVFAVLYFGWQLLCRCVPLRAWGARCGVFAFGALTAGGLSAVLLLPGFADIQSSKGVDFAYRFTGETGFRFAEIFHRLLPASFTWQNVMDGLPNVYCGTLIVVLVVIYFCAKEISVREKLLSGAFLGLLLLGMWSTDLSVLWHGFKAPIWFPYRQSFLFCFFCVLLAAKALGTAKLSKMRALAVAACGGAFLAACFLVRFVWFTTTLFAIGAMLCIAFCMLTFVLLCAKNRRVRAAALGVVLCGVMAEGVWNAVFTQKQFELYTKSDFETFVTQGKATVQAVNALDAGAYRLEKTYFRSLNDPMLLGYAGISHFSSAQDNAVCDLLDQMGYRSFGSSALYARGSTAFADSLLSIKYLFDDAKGFVPTHFVPAAISAAHKVYENPYVLPMAFSVPMTAEKFKSAENPSKTDTFAAQNALFAALTGETKPLYTKIMPAVNHRGSFDAAVTYEWTVPQSGTYYATLDTKDGSMVTLKAQKELGQYFTGDHCGVIQLGTYQKGQKASLTVTPVSGTMTLENPHFYVQNDTLLTRFAAKANAEKIAVTRTGSTLTAQGKFTGPLAFLSVPYDANLVAKVDGAPAKITSVGELLCAVPVTAGEHTITLSYKVRNLALGASISAASALALGAAFLIFRKKEKTKCQF